MAGLVDHSITNLINGVSQQAPSVRLDNQLEEQVNCFSDVTKGLTIRNGAQFNNLYSRDLSNRKIIEFSLDSERYVLGLDMTDPTQLVHIPLSANVNELVCSIDSTKYFDSFTDQDIKVVEDKDSVYILNRRSRVAEVNSKSAYVDVNTKSNYTGSIDKLWDSGTYSLTISSVATTGTKVLADLSVPIVRSTTNAQIANIINSYYNGLEVGVVSVRGDAGSYRISFNKLPNGFTAPNISTDAGTLQQHTTVPSPQPATGYYTSGPDYGANVPTYVWRYGLFNGKSYIYWGQSLSTQVSTVVAGNPSSLKLGNITYYRGPLLSGSTPNVKLYEIRREIYNPIVISYTPVVSSVSVVSGGSVRDTKATEAMVVVSGVSDTQSYSVSVSYALAGGGTGVANASFTVSGVSNIKLSTVAENLRVGIANSPLFATRYNNAIYIYANGNSVAEILNVTVDNSFDLTSIYGTVRSTTTNAVGVNSPSKLPATFIDGFKVRIGDESTPKDSFYYLEYSSSFQGWQEVALDSSRKLDASTLPHRIDKNEVRETGVITIHQAPWVSPKSGDSLSNKSPSFLDASVKDLFFYGSRLGLATADTMILSEINDSLNFYRTTTSKVLISDRVDIKLDGAKLGFSGINSVSPSNGALIVNAGNSQAELLVNTSFDLTKARLSLVSSYNLGEFKPVTVESEIYYSLSVAGVTNIYSFGRAANGYQSTQVTKHIPSYIKGNIIDIRYNSGVTIIRTDDDTKTLYVQSRFTSDGNMIQNSWHKWKLPYDILYTTFFNNKLNVLLKASDSTSAVRTLVCDVNLIPSTTNSNSFNGTQDIGWTPVLDCYTKDFTIASQFPEFIGMNTRLGTKFDTATQAHDTMYVSQDTLGAQSTPQYSSVSPVFKWKAEGNLNRITFNDGTEILAGNTNLNYLDNGGFRYFKGTESTTAGEYQVSRSSITNSTYYKDDILYGIPLQAKVTLSEVVPRQKSQDGSYVVMNYAILMLRRMRLLMGNSGLFNVSVKFKDRQGYTMYYTGQPLGSLTLDKAGISDINFSFPINAKADKVLIDITSSSGMPFNLLAAEWQGKLTQRGRNF